MFKPQLPGWPVVLVVVAATVLPVALSAGSVNAPLSVGVTVSRSCRVDATSEVQGSASVDLRCVEGAASNLRSAALVVPRIGDDRALRLEAPTTSFRGAPADASLQVVTLNF
jgi:hypothetical protein